jgi:RecA/RadA recombinase
LIFPTAENHSLIPAKGNKKYRRLIHNKFLCAFGSLRENSGVQARFLLGPAGSGKTFRCLAEVRAALARDPAGAPLILLAPKQATFQLERQLLAGGEISGFTRLNIFSFDRLAKFIFEQLNVAPPKLLSAEGRLMVLRALLQRHADELKLFRSSARRTGFAQELGTLLAELQQHQFTPARLRELAADEKLRRELRDKLHDLALLSEKYAGWLREHELQDVNNLLDFAAGALRGKTFNLQPSTFNLPVWNPFCPTATPSKPVPPPKAGGAQPPVFWNAENWLRLIMASPVTNNFRPAGTTARSAPISGTTSATICWPTSANRI